MGLRETEYRTTAEIRSPDFTASVPLFFSVITSDEVYWTEHEQNLAVKAIAIHILKKNNKDIQKEMERQEIDFEDYGNN